MALADDLIEQARHLAKREPNRPRQASLRRAVSTAYYALFHLLISSALLHWRGLHQRPHLARGFEHGLMKEASRRTISKQFDPADQPVADRLKLVAQAFMDLQQHRHAADYSYVKKWARAEVIDHIEVVANAFAQWKAIRHERIAKDYLISLLIKERKD